MQIAAYYQRQRCPKIERFGESLKRESRQSVFGRALRTACDQLASGTGYKEVLEETYASLLDGYGKIGGYYPWQAEMYAKDDVRKLRRFLVFIGKPKILKANVCTSFVDGDLILEGKASLIFEKEGKTYLVILRPGKCDRSAGGKSVLTKVSGDLRLLVAKRSLEEQYPGIVPWCVYMTHPDDKDDDVLKNFSIESTKNTNLTVLPIGGYYKDGVFQKEKIEEEIRAAAAVAPEKNCDDCEYCSLCKVGEEKFAVAGGEETSEETYVLPKFTKAQQSVVDHVNGPLRVCAGAGSGKTATLVGRIAKLVERGYAPQNILCLTFASKAAEELQKRCRALPVFDGKKPPVISTIHGLALDFLRGYGKEIDGENTKVLDELTKQRTIEALLEGRERIGGFKYEKKVGRYGLLNTVLNRIEELSSTGEAAFRAKHPDVGEGFYSLAKEYAEYVEREHLISFDEMVPKATQLLKENPEILGLYQMSYQFIMVDEFQDVSRDQAEFVYLLASESKNLVVVGDDDQCIYRWRGAVPSYLVDFPKLFGAKTVVYPDNFRSTNEIVATAQRVIRKNSGRIEKKIVSSSGRKGSAPEVIHSTAVADFQRIIGDLLKEGYHYGDVAIIARTNKTLKEFKEKLGCPSTIAKTYLRQDGFFNFVKSVLDLYADPTDAMAFTMFASPFGLQELGTALGATGRAMELARETKELNGPMEILDELFEVIRQAASPKDFIQKAAMRLFWDRSDAPSVLTDEFRMAFPNDADLGDLREYCREVTEYQSEKRVTEKSTDSVTLITNHDCKGLEYPVVLIHSDYSEATDEERCLFYVALTRAKEKCFIFENPNAKASFLPELLEEAK